MGALVDFLSWSWSPTVVLGMAILGLLLIPKVFKHHSKIDERTEQHTLQFNDRSDMIVHRGGLDNELKRVGYAWVAFETGSQFRTLDNKLVPKVRRILMLHPECQLLQDWTAFDKTTEQAIASIKANTLYCSKLKNVEIRWTTKPLMNCIIGDPDADSAWIRVNCQIPLTQSSQWPGYVVYKQGDPEHFERLKESYERIWEDAQPYDSAKI